jgi:hypothetical protein
VKIVKLNEIEDDFPACATGSDGSKFIPTKKFYYRLRVIQLKGRILLHSNEEIASSPREPAR